MTMAKLALVFDVVYVIDKVDPDNPPVVDTETMIEYMKEKLLEEPRMNGLTGTWVPRPSRIQSVNVEVAYDELIEEE